MDWLVLMRQLLIPSLLKFVNFQIFCLDKGLSITFITETMENGEKVFSVMRWFNKDGAVVECRNRPFPEGDETGLSVYDWQKNGTYYQMTVEEDKADAAEKLMKDFYRD